MALRQRHICLAPLINSQANAALNLCVVVLVSMSIMISRAESTEMLIGDFSGPGLVSAIGTRWRSVSDTVMGGVSQADIAHDTINNRNCLRLGGDVRLGNNGGFIQPALDRAPENGSPELLQLSCCVRPANSEQDECPGTLKDPDTETSLRTVVKATAKHGHTV